MYLSVHVFVWVIVSIFVFVFVFVFDINAYSGMLVSIVNIVNDAMSAQDKLC